MRQLVFGGRTLQTNDRMKVVIFMFGNGIPPKYICVLMQPILRDKAAQEHLTRILNKACSAYFDKKWFYYNVNENDYLFLNQTPCDVDTLQKYGIKTGEKFILQRKINEWSKFSAKFETTRKMEQEFLSDLFCTDPRAFFSKSIA